MKANRGNRKKKKGSFVPENVLYSDKDIQYKLVDDLFKKRFVIKSNEQYTLPKPEAMFNENSWKIERLQSLKSELNGVKNLLNNYNLDKWHSHTNFRSSARDVMIRVRRDIQPEFVTRAWCKFYEIVSTFPLVPIDHIASANNQFKSVHLCEAPGAFVTSLNHWLRTNVPLIIWDWIATTLNPYYEGNPLSIMIDDDRFMRYTLNHWYFGKDNTGNLMSLTNLEELLKMSEPHEKIFLVTADGSIDCTDVPGEQETVVAHLHYCETVAALQLLATGGSFLLKLFTIFEHHTVCLMYLLSCCFNKVDVVKPATSREGNSEIYVVCTNFKGAAFVAPYLDIFRKNYESGCTKAMFSQNDIPDTFINRIIECGEFFKSQQCLAIMSNIHTFASDSDVNAVSDIKHIQRIVSDKYMKDCDLKRLSFGEIVGKTILDKRMNITLCKQLLQDSYNERCEKQHLSPWKRLRDLFTDSSSIKIDTPVDQFIEFKVYKLPEDIWIRSGKIFHKVNSSRFCNAHVLIIKNTVDNILHDLGYNVSFPTSEKINNLEQKILTELGYAILSFQYTDTYDSHKLFSKIHEKLQILENGQTLVLIGYSLLTHFSVGLLYLISCLFDILQIKLCSDVGLQIILQNYNYNIKVLKYLLDIKTACYNEQENGNTILTVLPAPFLYGSDLFSTVVDVNHWVTKLYVEHVAQMVEKDMTNEEKNM